MCVKIVLIGILLSSAMGFAGDPQISPPIPVELEPPQIPPPQISPPQFQDPNPLLVSPPKAPNVNLLDTFDSLNKTAPLNHTSEVPVVPPKEDHRDRKTVELGEMRKSLIGKVEAGSKMGLCSPEIADAAKILQDIVFSRAGESYKEGRAGSVWGSNQGLAAYFGEKMSQSPQMLDDVERLRTKIQQLDSSVTPPLKQSSHGPHIDEKARFDVYQLALQITEGNAYQAATIVGAVGHDDVNGISSDSNLYAPGSVGVFVDDKTMGRLRKASLFCQEVGGDCRGNFGAHNYHMNFGLFLGCEFIKRGIEKGTANKLFAQTTATAVLNDPFINNDLACRKTVGGGLSCNYEFNLCTDVPKMLGYYYKKTTMGNWLTADARFLYDKGYNLPFMAEEGKADSIIPKEWSENRRNQAIANLDYRLMHLEYGSAQVETGAKKGAEVCQKYKKEELEKVPDSDARQLMAKGYTNPALVTADLDRAPSALRKSPEKLEKAWNAAIEYLDKNPTRFEYGIATRPLSLAATVRKAFEPANGGSFAFLNSSALQKELEKAKPEEVVAEVAKAIDGQPAGIAELITRNFGNFMKEAGIKNSAMAKKYQDVLAAGTTQPLKSLSLLLSLEGTDIVSPEKLSELAKLYKEVESPEIRASALGQMYYRLPYADSVKPEQIAGAKELLDLVIRDGSQTDKATAFSKGRGALIASGLLSYLPEEQKTAYKEPLLAAFEKDKSFDLYEVIRKHFPQDPKVQQLVMPPHEPKPLYGGYGSGLSGGMIKLDMPKHFGKKITIGEHEPLTPLEKEFYTPNHSYKKTLEKLEMLNAPANQIHEYNTLMQQIKLSEEQAKKSQEMMKIQIELLQQQLNKLAPDKPAEGKPSEEKKPEKK